MAVHFVELAAEAIARNGRFTVALSGGSTPQAAFQLLAAAPYTGRVDWDRVHIFWVDERCVPPDHPDSNYRLARRSLLDRVRIPADQIHPMRGDLTPEQAAAEYDALIRRLFNAGPPAVNTPHEFTGDLFDLAWMGMGADGHTASLFLGHPALWVVDRWAAAVEHRGLPEPAVDRITLTRPALRRARQMTFLVSGADKSDALRRIFQPALGNQAPTLPAAQVWPDSDHVLWLADTAAAANLSESSD
jgi:6-phosphogluconolactonase